MDHPETLGHNTPSVSMVIVEYPIIFTYLFISISIHIYPYLYHSISTLFLFLFLSISVSVSLRELGKPCHKVWLNSKTKTEIRV